MRNDIRITLVQSPIAWEDKSTNWKAYENRLASLKGTTDIALLPEMFTTGFSMEAAKWAETNDGETIRRVKAWASRFDMAIAGSFIATEGGCFFNRAFFAEPSGLITFYDKRHLFRMAGEDQVYTQGKNLRIISYRGWNICLQICYDLRFPVWSRNQKKAYDLLLYIANWPEARASVWQPLLMARAIENQAYVCGVNRTGTDGKGVRYRGDSVLFSPKGKKLLDASDAEECLLTGTISASEQERFREKFPVWLDADVFRLEI